MSETKPTTLAAALVAFQQEAPDLHKDSTATVPTKSGGSFSYSYIGLDKAMAQIRPLLVKHGLAVMQFPTSLDGQPALRTKLIHGDSGEFEQDTMLLFGASDPQGQGSAITYARRYSLMALLGLVADEDKDGAQPQAQRTTETGEVKTDAQNRKVFAQIKELEELGAKPWDGAADWKIAIEARCQAMFGKGLGSLLKSEASTVIEALDDFLKTIPRENGAKAPDTEPVAAATSDDDVPF